MSESKVFLSVGLDEVVDSDAFRLTLLEAECALPEECVEPRKAEPEQA